MAAMGIDLTPHRSRIVDATMIRAADVVIGMERLHVREAVVLAPEMFGHTFTLKELVRRGESVGPRGDEPVEQWMARISAGRRPLDQLGWSADDDVADPFGRSVKVYAATAAELDDLVSRLGPTDVGSGRRGAIGLTMRVAIGSDHAGFELEAASRRNTARTRP